MWHRVDRVATVWLVPGPRVTTGPGPGPGVATTGSSAGDAVPRAWGADATSVTEAVGAVAGEQTRPAVAAGAGVDLTAVPLARLVELVVVPVVVDRVSASASAVVLLGSVLKSSHVVGGAVVVASYAVVASSSHDVSVAISVSRADARARATASLVPFEVSSAACAVRASWALCVHRARRESPAEVSSHASTANIHEVGSASTSAVSFVWVGGRGASACGPLVAVVADLSREAVGAFAALVLLGASVAGASSSPVSVPALVGDTSLPAGASVSVGAASMTA